MINPLHEYNKKIQKKEILAPKRVKKVYQRLIDELSSNKSKYFLDEQAGYDVIYFVERFCKMSKAPFTGQPMKLELFQKAKIMALYGIKSKETGYRRFNECFDFRARKNGKSTELSALALYHLVGDKEGGAEVYSVATKLDQAKRVYQEAINMKNQSKELNKHIKKRKDGLHFDPLFSFFTALASDSDTLDGLNSSCIIIDEAHAIKERRLYDVLKRSISSRMQPMIHIITTAGMIRDSIFDSLYEYAKNVADGVIVDDSLFPLLYQLDSKEEWKNPVNWIKANPGLGIIKRIDYLQKEVEKAKNVPSELRNLLCYDFNIIETSNESWLDFDVINNEATFELQDVYDTYAIGGCDLSATTDLTCATLLIRKREDLHIYVLQQYFLPRTRIDVLENTSSKEAPYKIWADRGLLTICDGSMVNYSDVTKWFVTMAEEHQISLYKCGYDRALAGYWVQEMEDYFGLSVMEKVAQGPITWTTPMKELGAKLQDKLINYNNNPILKWCLTNTGVKTTGTVESIQPIKIQSNRRIDGMVSLLNAYTVYLKYYDEFNNTVG